MTKLSRLVCYAALYSCMAASAAPVTYQLQGVTFSDGGTASGSFAFDPATMRYTNVNIVTTNGGVRTGAIYRFVCGQDVPTCLGITPPSAGLVLNLTSTSANQTGMPAFALGFTPALSTAPGNAVLLGGVEASCSDVNCLNGIAPGRGVTGGTVLAIAGPTTTDDTYQLRYFANLAAGDSYINITNAGTLSGSDPTGRICVNVYTFDPAEELVSCCACPLTPNGLVSLSARNDLISNTLTPGVPTSITVKLLSSVPVAGTCNAASPTASNLARGMRAWATTIHARPGNPLVYDTTETPFSIGELSASELTKLSSFCGFIQTIGSGFGICRSCRAGALGSGLK